MERQFVEGAARTAYVMAWVEREENPPAGLRQVGWHDRTQEDVSGVERGTWGEYQTQGHRAFTPWPSGDTIYLFDDEVDFDRPAPVRSFASQKLENVAPPPPDYAREWAWKLLGALEEINPQWGSNLPSIVAAAQRADCAPADGLCGANKAFRQSGRKNGATNHHKCRLDVRAFGSNVAMMALGTGVFDDHAVFELHVPEWDARGFELEED